MYKSSSGGSSVDSPFSFVIWRNKTLFSPLVAGKMVLLVRFGRDVWSTGSWWKVFKVAILGLFNSFPVLEVRVVQSRMKKVDGNRQREHFGLFVQPKLFEDQRNHHPKSLNLRDKLLTVVFKAPFIEIFQSGPQRSRKWTTFDEDL